MPSQVNPLIAAMEKFVPGWGAMNESARRDYVRSHRDQLTRDLAAFFDKPESEVRLWTAGSASLLVNSHQAGGLSGALGTATDRIREFGQTAGPIAIGAGIAGEIGVGDGAGTAEDAARKAAGGAGGDTSGMSDWQQALALILAGGTAYSGAQSTGEQNQILREQQDILNAEAGDRGDIRQRLMAGLGREVPQRDLSSVFAGSSNPFSRPIGPEAQGPPPGPPPGPATSDDLRNRLGGPNVTPRVPDLGTPTVDRGVPEQNVPQGPGGVIGELTGGKSTPITDRLPPNIRRLLLGLGGR